MNQTLHDTNSGSDLRSFSIRMKTNISLLGSVWTDQSVDLDGIDIVKSLDSVLDLRLVCTNVGDKDQSVVVFNLFHCRFGSQWKLDDGVLVETRCFWD